jgi:hypothetical protein
MKIGQTLAISAALGVLAGCGAEPPPAAAAPTTDTSASAGAKASCGGAEHTDKGHCGGLGVQGAAPAPSASASAAAPATK